MRLDPLLEDGADFVDPTPKIGSPSGVCACPWARARPPFASAAAIPFLDDVDSRRDFLDFLPSGGLSDWVVGLPKVVLDLMGRRSLLDIVELERSRPLVRIGAEATEAASAGAAIVCGAGLGVTGRAIVSYSLD